MSGFLWGVAAVLTLSLIVNLFDSSTRRDLAEVGAALLWMPAHLAIMLVLLVLWLLRLAGGRRAYRVSGEAVRMWLDRTEARAFAIQRPSQTILVFTKPRKETDRG